jgi:hypothetical protein
MTSLFMASIESTNRSLLKICYTIFTPFRDILTETEDKLVTKAVDRVKKEIQKAKDKEKKMWGKVFG